MTEVVGCQKTLALGELQRTTRESTCNQNAAALIAKIGSVRIATAKKNLIRNYPGFYMQQRRGGDFGGYLIL